MGTNTYWQQIVDLFNSYDVYVEYNKHGASYEGYYFWYNIYKNDLKSEDDVKKAKQKIINNLNE